jgi:hypothetical protein
MFLGCYFHLVQGSHFPMVNLVFLIGGAWLRNHAAPMDTSSQLLRENIKNGVNPGAPRKSRGALKIKQ